LYSVGRVLLECLGSPTDADEGGLIAITRSLLAQEPDARYPDARALLGDLERVQSKRPIRGPSGYAATRFAAHFVGRDAELRRLTRSWNQVAAPGGTGAVVLVQGVRGSGKTRLLGAFRADLRGGVRAVSLGVACHENDPPLSALRAIFRALLGSISRAPE